MVIFTNIWLIFDGKQLMTLRFPMYHSVTQEARLPFRTVIQLDPSTHRCQKILGLLTWPAVWSFIVVFFFAAIKHGNTHNPPC